MGKRSKKKVLELLDLRAYMKLVAENKMTVYEVCSRLNISRSTYKRATESAKQDGLMEAAEAPNNQVRIPKNPLDLRAYAELVAENRISVNEVCRRLNIGRSTYYRWSREMAKTAIEGESEESRFIEVM